jgi:hypothetical protein
MSHITCNSGILTLPMKNLESFTSGGGIFTDDKTAAHEAYDGAPRPYNRNLMTNQTEADLDPGGLGLGTGYHHTASTGIGYENGSTNARPRNSSLENKADPRVDSNMDGSRYVGTGGLPQNGHTSEIGGHTRANGPNTTTTTTTDTTTHAKPSMMEKNELSKYVSDDLGLWEI